MRKVDIDVKCRLVINVDDNQDVNDVLENMDYDFISNHDSADVYYTEIMDWDIKDSK